MLSPSDLNYFEQSLPFWKHLTKNEQELLIERTTIKSFAKGITVYHGRNECVGVILIKKGSLRTYLLSQQGKEITLYRQYAGEICVLSASCLLDNITFDVAINTEEPTELYIIPSTIFSNLTKNNLYLENFLYETTIEKFSSVMWTMEQILFLRFDQRLAIFLLEESNKCQSNLLSLTHSQIATYIGSAREVVSRMLKYFEDENWVRLSRGTIELLDKDSLKELIENES